MLRQSGFHIEKFSYLVLQKGKKVEVRGKLCVTDFNQPQTDMLHTCVFACVLCACVFACVFAFVFACVLLHVVCVISTFVRQSF